MYIVACKTNITVTDSFHAAQTIALALFKHFDQKVIVYIQEVVQNMDGQAVLLTVARYQATDEKGK